MSAAPEESTEPLWLAVLVLAALLTAAVVVLNLLAPTSCTPAAHGRCTTSSPATETRR